MSEKHSPLDQFLVKPIAEFNLAGYDVSFTNSALFMTIAVGMGIMISIMGIMRPKIVPGRSQGFVEMVYEFVSNIVIDNVGQEGKKFVPLIFTTFIFIVLCNLLGMIPTGFTATSHLTVNLAIAGILFIVLIVYGFYRHGLHFLSLFVPSGLPKFFSSVYRNN